MVVIQRISQAQTLTRSKKIYHISDEFFKEVFQKFLWGEQRGLVQLLLPQVIVVMHWLQRNMKDKVSAWHNAPVNYSTKIQMLAFWIHLVDIQKSSWHLHTLGHRACLQQHASHHCCSALKLLPSLHPIFPWIWETNWYTFVDLLKNEARHTNTWRYTKQIWILKEVWGWIHKEFIALEVACCFFSTWRVESFTELLSSNIKGFPWNKNKCIYSDLCLVGMRGETPSCCNESFRKINCGSFFDTGTNNKQ